MNWHNSAFVATPENVPASMVPDYIDTLFIQVAWGTRLPDPPITPQRLALLRNYFSIAAWAWCEGGSQVEEEAHWHAQMARQIGATAFVANMEEPYDAHANASDPRFLMPARYLKALQESIGSMPIGLTTTPRFGSDMREWIKAEAIYMPQAFPQENHTSVSEAVLHAIAWGWSMDCIRPLVQTYMTNKEWADPVVMNAEATKLKVGVVPYVIETAIGGGDGGMAVIQALSESIKRPNPFPEDPKDEIMAKLIGDQHGIVAAYNRMKKLDPGGCNPRFDPNNYDALPLDQLKAWDKWARTLMILREDHDSAMK